MKFARTPFLLLLALCVVAHSCKEEPPNAPTQPPPPLPPQPVQTIALTVVDSASVEAWLKLSMPDTVKERRYRLFLNDSLIWQSTLNAPDTLMLLGDYLGSNPFRLTPATPYRVRVERVTADTFNVTVDEKTFRTLDTTSQDYTWQYLSFGTGLLQDVCVINDSCIWAVGRISLGQYDSLGAPIIYNAMRYDGKKWEYFALGFPILSGKDTVLIPFEAFSVFGFSANNVWFSDGGSYLHWDGNQYRKYVFAFGSGLSGALKMWGTSSNNLYGINDLGFIMHFDGAVWRRMESGTTTNLIDIYGTPDGESVWVAGYTNTNNQIQSCLLSLENGQWRTLWQRGQSSMYISVQALWTSGSSEYVVLGNAFAYFHSRLMPNDPSFHRIKKDLSPGGGLEVRGSSRNNFACGGQGAILWHFNGIRWKRFPELYAPRTIYGIGVTEKLIVAVGVSYEPTIGGAMVLIGRKP